MVRGLRQRGSLLLLAALVLLLAVLAWLQYRWTSDVGRAETERRRTQLERSGAAFASALGRELGLVLAGFRMEPGLPLAERRRLLIDHIVALREHEPAGLVSDVWLVTRDHEGGEPRLERCHPGSTDFQPAAWTPRIEFLRSLAAELTTSGLPGTARRGAESPPWRALSFRDPPPMVVVPLLDVEKDTAGDSGPHWLRLGLTGLAAVEFDEACLRQRLLPQLAESHFGPLAASELVVAVLRRADGSIVYASTPELTADELKRADFQLPLPGLTRAAGFMAADPRGREPFGAGLSAFGGPSLRGRWPPPETGLVLQSPRPFDLGPGPGVSSRPRRLPDEGAPWLLVVRHRGGSLEQSVARLVRRNLAIGLAVLALLGAAAVLLVSSAQRARGLARQQLEFVAGVTHELNTPLAGIRSAGQNLAAGIVSDPEKVRRYGVMIEQEGRRLSAIVAQVLDFAGIESERRAYASAPQSLAAVVEDVVAELGLALEQAGVSLERNLPPDLPAVRGDAAALRRVVANLLTNAVKFAAEGRRVLLSAESHPARRTVLLRVEDRGPGIPPAERERVFEPFYRGGAAQRNHAPGSGLGLSLVQRIVLAHGGRVWIEQPEDGGTAVAIELPAADSASGAGS